MLQILNKTQLQIPLFHGTSTLFLDNINQYGLGRYDQLKEYRAMEMLEELYGVCREYTNFTWADPVSNLVCEKILSKDDTSWQYNGTFLSTSRYKAWNHATLNSYGSELLSAAMYLYDVLLACGLKYSLKDSSHNCLITQLQRSQIYPCMLRVDHANLSNLKLDRHSGIELEDAVLELEREYLTNPDACGDLCQIDFICPYGVDLSWKLIKFDQEQNGGFL